MDRSQPDLQYLALPTAAAVVHIQVVGRPPDARAASEMRDTLNDVAHSIATLAPIYSLDETATVATAIPAADLIDGTFTRGAHIFITKMGREYRRLAIQRGDMNAAIAILQKAGAVWAR